jgi:hypothetical protein
MHRWLIPSLTLPSKKKVAPTLSFFLTDIKSVHAHMHLDRAFMPITKFDYDPIYLDVACRTMFLSLGYTA